MKISRIFNNIQKKSFSRFFFSTRNSKTAKKCFYKILNVSAQANFEEIKASYIDLAKKYHPDTKFGDKIQEVTK